MTSREIRALADTRIQHMQELYTSQKAYSGMSREEKVYSNKLTALMNHIRLLDIDYDSKLSCLLSQIEELEQPIGIDSLFTTNNSNSI